MAHPSQDYLIYQGGNTPTVNILGNQTNALSSTHAFGFLLGLRSSGSASGGVTTISNNNLSNINSTGGFYGFEIFSSTNTQQMNFTEIRFPILIPEAYSPESNTIPVSEILITNTISSVSAGDNSYGIYAEIRRPQEQQIYFQITSAIYRVLR
jgi:hypothetical protein